MDQEKASFETKLQRLQEIVDQLEQGDLSLDEGIALFKEGSQLAQNCREQLKQAQLKVQTYAQGILQDYELEERNEQDSDNGQT